MTGGLSVCAVLLLRLGYAYSVDVGYLFKGCVGIDCSFLEMQGIAVCSGAPPSMLWLPMVDLGISCS